MTVPAFSIQPRQASNYSIEVDGLEVALCSGVQVGDIELTEVRHAEGGQSWDTKFAGGVNFGDLTLEKIMFVNDPDNWAWDWMNIVINFETGALGLADDYKKTIIVSHLGPDKNPLQSWEFQGCWPKRRSVSKNDALDKAAKMMETVLISVDRALTLG